MSHLFDTLSLRAVTLRNRIGVSPMCEYSSENGLPNDWHTVHLGSRAVGGAGLVMTEATAVEARGRISLGDTGIWSDAHTQAWAPIAAFVQKMGAVPGMQIAHAGRKASTGIPWEGGKAVSDADGGWEPLAPTALAFDPTYRTPREMSLHDIKEVTAAFGQAAARAQAAGFKWLEIHSAHGYLLHEFLSPLANKRTDDYGGSFDNRIRFLLETVREVRRIWPADLPLAVRLSCTDWTEGGWTIEDSIELSRRMKPEGVDLIDCSSGGIAPGIRIPAEPNYQVPFAQAIRQQADIATAAVGLITEPAQAAQIVRDGQADMVLLARASLRDPYWALHAARTLGQQDRLKPPVQYERAYA